MKTLKELRKELADKKTAARAQLAEYNTLLKKADATTADTARIAELDGHLQTAEAEIEALAADVEAAETAKRRAELFNGSRAAFEGARTVNEPDPARTFGFNHIVEFARAVVNASSGRGMDERLRGAPTEANAPSVYQQNQGSGNEGFLVPPDYSKTVWDMTLDNTDLLGMANPEPTSSNSVGMPTDQTTPWGSAGVQAYWGAEAGQYKASVAQVTATLMQLHKLYAFVGATDEILSDAPMLRNRLTIQSGKALKWKASDAIMWGTGAGQPTGFMNAPALITASKDSGQATGTITVSNLMNMLKRVLRLGGRPVWLANQDTIAQLGQLVLGNIPVWIPFNQGVQDSMWDGMILGYPCIFTEHAQSLTTAGDITLVNMDGYYASTKAGGIDFAESMHLYFDQGITAFRWTFRLGGQPILSAPVNPARGSTTKSHFIALQSR